jgi:hypothetical protein
MDHQPATPNLVDIPSSNIYVVKVGMLARKLEIGGVAFVEAWTIC